MVRPPPSRRIIQNTLRSAAIMSIVPDTAVPRAASTSTSSPRPSLDQSGTCTWTAAATLTGPRLAAILRRGLR